MRPFAAASALAALAAISACAGGAGPSPSSPPILGYEIDAGTDQSYSQVDTTTMALDMGGQMIDVDIRLDALLDMAFQPAAEGIRVTASWRELEAVITNSMTGTERTGPDDVDGPLVFTLDRTGAAAVVSTPVLKGSAQQMVVPQEVAQGFFPRLPGAPPTPGMTWTDTVAYESEIEGNRTADETILTYTVLGDTLVGGRSLLKVRAEGTGTTSREGVTQGMDFAQDLSGTVEGYFLWDREAGVVRYRWNEMNYSGTMTVTAAPFPLGVDMRGVTHVRLVEDDGGR